MSVPNSSAELLALIRKSGMVEESRLVGWLSRRSVGRGVPGDPREAADAMIQDGILTNFQAEQFLLGKWRGFTIGKFKLLERVGVGGMGQVFLCEHMFMKRRLAVKVLPPAKAEHPAALGRFYREARAAGTLEHPNIVRTHDIDQDGNLHFIVMEYVDGSNLLEIVKKFGPMEIGRALSYTQQIAKGLDYAFKSGIIHRDIKPGNVLIDRRGTARILDMGLARFFMDQTDNLTVKYDDKIVLGTADYVAPEQVANSHSVDVRADIYALGATLYFLLAGHPPFPTGTVSQKLIWHRTKEPTPIRQVRPEVSEELETILIRMMAKDPYKRYQTPAEVLSAVAPLVPKRVAAPDRAEMPQLCSAVTEGQSTVDTVSDTERPIVEEEVVLVGAGSASRPVEARLGGSVVKPFAAPFVAPSAPVAPFGRDNRLSNPFPSPGSRGPFSGGTSAEHTPLPPAQPPLPNRASRMSSVPQQPPPSPYIGEAPVDDAARRNMAAVIALVAACLVLAGGLAYWKYGDKPKPQIVPAPVHSK